MMSDALVPTSPGLHGCTEAAAVDWHDSNVHNRKGGVDCVSKSNVANRQPSRLPSSMQLERQVIHSRALPRSLASNIIVSPTIDKRVLVGHVAARRGKAHNT